MISAISPMWNAFDRNLSGELYRRLSHYQRPATAGLFVSGGLARSVVPIWNGQQKAPPERGFTISI